MIPTITHHFADKLYAKQAEIAQGTLVTKHTHNFSHLSILAQGKVQVTTPDTSQIYSGYACIEIKANVEHTILALEDSVWFCIHVSDEKDVTKIDESILNNDKEFS
jgi:quercetin dioxygenase-like cupin family protein